MAARTGTEYLAGSAIELVSGVENSVRFAGISLPEAITMATLQPLRLLGEKKEINGIGDDLILFEWNPETFKIDLKMTVLNGQVVDKSS